jgi:hypothetical protein
MRCQVLSAGAKWQVPQVRSRAKVLLCQGALRHGKGHPRTRAPAPVHPRNLMYMYPPHLRYPTHQHPGTIGTQALEAP